jgi:2-dehydro-3-deoxyphosphogluconate aldolase/(4S)-4-hydroxy-2-oxoglutarate aldolase
MTAPSLGIGELLDRAPVIPVIVIDDEAVAVPLARALVAGGLSVLEVTLRTECALACIKRIAEEVPDAVVGAGTVLSPTDVTASVAAGSQFLVSPGSTPTLLDAMLDSGAAPLPAAATVSEVIGLMERGLSHSKFFPAVPAGGVAYLKGIAGPLPDFRFCPTGGIDLASAPRFLALRNVACVGGSWVTPSDAVSAGDWGRIEKLAREAAGLRPA